MNKMSIKPAKSYDTETLLQAIIVDMQQEYHRGKSQVPLAAICKRLNTRMSTLQRHFTLLDSLGFAYTLCDETGRWIGYLTIQGVELPLTTEQSIPENDADAASKSRLSAPKLVNP